MRAFVAIFPPPEIQETLLRAAKNISVDGNIRWVRRENVHLTLKFLGDIEEGMLEGVRAALAEVAGRHGPFYVRPSGLGAFPSGKKARILWAGTHKGSPALSSLAEDVESMLEPLGFGRERRGYKPHATLGRVRGRPVRLPDSANIQAPKFAVRRLDLIESILGAEGATYRKLESYLLSRNT